MAVEVFLGVLVFTSCVKAVQCDRIKVKSMGVVGFGRDGCLVKFVWTQRQSERLNPSVCMQSFLPSIQLSNAANKLHLDFHLEFCPPIFFHKNNC